ncbi:MAG: sulfite exporter TauE/SafE family protein [Steroidobacteraceae bacterium]
MSPTEFALAGLAAAGAGIVNALAGGGTLISFPALLAMGVPPIAANVTNAVALCPGYFGATLAQATHLRGQQARLRWCIPAAVIGGLLGGVILLRTHERTFQALVPYMLMLASVLLALQERVRAFVLRRLANAEGPRHSPLTAALPVTAAAVYGGFFSAGMSILVLAVVGVTVEDSFTRLNALKQVLAFSINIAAAVFFLFSGQVLWLLAAVMAVGALLGGVVGGKLAGKIPPAAMRWLVVTVGFALAVYYWMK